VKPKLLLVDDEENILQQMRWSMEADYEIFTASNEEVATQIFAREHPPVVILDLSLSRHKADDLGGLRLLEQFLSAEPATRAIVLTGISEDVNAMRAVRLGACDFYAKPLRLDEIKVIVQRSFHIYRLQQKLQEKHPGAADGFDGIMGRSKPMKDIFRFIERVAGSDISVLICGESGTGKEVVANTIHRHSLRKNNPFVVVNCGAIPENFLESELFGHEKGAFTGAHAQKKGKFELAHTGTLFLDEIGEMAQPLQVKLLRFLQDRRIERVGGTQPVEVDLRIIAATNRDLQKDVKNHIFCEDLYYRLKVIPLNLPPLRERKDDIIPMAQHFLRKSCQEYRKPPMSFSAETESAMLVHSWPGNVRELENLIRGAVVLSPRSILRPSDLGFAFDITPTEVNLKFAKQAIEIDFVRKALTRNRGIVSRAARELGISRVNLYELIDKYAIQVKQFKNSKTGKNSELNYGR
jgi:two-component system NtrC family response regulator